MLLKRSLSLVLFAVCLSLSIGCSGDKTPAPTGHGEPQDGNLGSAVDQLPDETDKVTDEKEQTADAVKRQAKESTGSALDLSYITDDFVAAVFSYPAREFNSDFAKELAEDEWLLEQTAKGPAGHQLTLDWPQVEQLVILIDNAAVEKMIPGIGPLVLPPIEQGGLDAPEADPEPVHGAGIGPETAAPPVSTIIVRFKAAVNPDEFFENASGLPLEDAEIDGFKVKQTPSAEVVYHFADARTLIGTQPKHLKKMLETKSAESALISELRRIESSPYFLCVADLRRYRAVVELNAWGFATLLPPDLSDLVAITTKIKMLTITAGNNDSLLSITAVMDSVEEAATANTKLSKGLKQARQWYEQNKSLAYEDQSLYSEEELDEWVAMADDIVAGLSHEADGNRLTVTIPKPGNIDRLPALMKPAIELAKKSEDDTKRMNNLHQIVIAFHNHADVHRAFPGAGSDASGEKKGLSWRVHILKELGYEELYNKFHLDEPWDSEHNKTLIDQMPEIYKSRGVDDSTKTSFHMFVGQNAYSMVGGTSLRDITDGPSNTFLVVEAGPDKAEIWTKPGGLTLNAKDPIASVGTLVDDVFLASFADTSVTVISTKAETPESIKAMITINGGEPVGDF